MCGFYCIAFIEYMLSGKTLLLYNNLLCSNDYKRIEKIIYENFEDKYVTSRVQIKKIDETKNHAIEEIRYNESISESIKRHVSIWIMLNSCLF